MSTLSLEPELTALKGQAAAFLLSGLHTYNRLLAALGLPQKARIVIEPTGLSRPFIGPKGGVMGNARTSRCKPAIGEFHE